MLKINLMIQEDSVVSFMCYTAVYNLELAKRAYWAPIFNFSWRFVKKRVLRDEVFP